MPRTSNGSRAEIRRSPAADELRSGSRILRPLAPAGPAAQRAAAGETVWRDAEKPSTAAPAPLSRVLVRAGRRLIVVPLDEVDWIEAAGNYVRLHGESSSHRFRLTLDALSARLDPRHFVRTHRSTIVNVSRIRELHPTGSGGYDLVLGDGTRLPLSRSYKRRVFAILGKE